MEDFGEYSYLIFESDMTEEKELSFIDTFMFCYRLRRLPHFGDSPLLIRATWISGGFTTYALDSEESDEFYPIAMGNWSPVIMLLVKKTKESFLCCIIMSGGRIVEFDVAKNILKPAIETDLDYFADIFEKHIPQKYNLSVDQLTCCHGFWKIPDWVMNRVRYCQSVSTWYVAGGCIYLAFPGSKMIVRNRPEDGSWGFIYFKDIHDFYLAQVVFEDGEEIIYKANVDLKNPGVYAHRITSWESLGEGKGYSGKYETKKVAHFDGLAIVKSIFNNRDLMGIHRSINQNKQYLENPSAPRIIIQEGRPVIHRAITLGETIHERQFEEFARALQDVSWGVARARLPRDVCFLIFLANECCGGLP